jgi:hypothetical protein
MYIVDRWDLNHMLKLTHYPLLIVYVWLVTSLMYNVSTCSKFKLKKSRITIVR